MQGTACGPFPASCFSLWLLFFSAGGAYVADYDSFAIRGHINDPVGFGGIFPFIHHLISFSKEAAVGFVGMAAVKMSIIRIQCIEFRIIIAAQPALIFLNLSCNRYIFVMALFLVIHRFGDCLPVVPRRTAVGVAADGAGFGGCAGGGGVAVTQGGAGGFAANGTSFWPFDRLCVIA